MQWSSMNGIIFSLCTTVSYLIEFNLEWKVGGAPVCGNINNIVDAIREINCKADNKFKYILVLDEVEIWDDHFDLSDLKLYYDDIDVLIAINPIRRDCQNNCKVILKEDCDSIIEQLRFKHRSSTEICVFNIHLAAYTIQDEETPINSSEDVAIVDTTYASGRKPILILKAKHISDEIVLQTIEEFLLQKDRNDLILIYNYNFSRQRSLHLNELCKYKSWKFVTEAEMPGIEAAVTVVFYGKKQFERSFEAHTRARNLLVIVQE